MMQPLAIAGLAKRFDLMPVLRDVDLVLEREQVTALVGPNAAGKSTLIKCVLGLVRANAGRITVFGEAAGADPHYRRFIGYMPQLPRFPENLTGQEVLDFLASLRSDQADNARVVAEAIGLTAETLARPVRTLSGGSRQKLNAVVALRYDAPLLILDEPTASLDPLSSGHLKDLVRRRKDNGAAVLLTSHVMAEVEELADRLVYLVEGSVRFNGSIDELRLVTGELKVERAIAQLMRQAA